MVKKFNRCFVLIALSITGNGMARYLLVDVAEEKRISDKGAGWNSTAFQIENGAHETNCGQAEIGIANCIEKGDDGASCVYGHHCWCSGRFVCDGYTYWRILGPPWGTLNGPGECMPGVSCIPSKSGPSPKRNPSFKAKPAPKAKSGALLLRSGPSPKRNPSFKAKPAPKAKLGVW